MTDLKKRLPRPGLVQSAAADYARDIWGEDAPKTPEDREARQDGIEALEDAYAAGALETARAIVTGEFIQDPELRADGVECSGLYRAWFNSLPEESAPLAPATVEVGLSPRAHTSEYFERYCKQPCEAYAFQLVQSLNNWTGQDIWQNIGVLRAISQDIARRHPSSGVWRYSVFLAAVGLFRSRHAPTWNDYYATLWRLRRGVAPVVELHRRAHLTGPKWAPVSSSALWCLASLRAQYPEFESDFRAGVVACETCDSLAIAAREKAGHSTYTQS
jgi:hypothetical protein